MGFVASAGARTFDRAREAASGSRATFVHVAPRWGTGNALFRRRARSGQSDAAHGGTLSRVRDAPCPRDGEKPCGIAARASASRRHLRDRGKDGGRMRRATHSPHLSLRRKAKIMELRPLARTRPPVDFSRAQVASELGRALDMLVLELGVDDIRRTAMDHRTGILELRFLRTCTQNIDSLRRMIRRKKRQSNGAN